MNDSVLPKVGYVLKRYPRYSETFVVNEILAHEAAGLDVSIFALRTPTDRHFQPEIADVRAPVSYLRRGGVSASTLWEEIQRTAVCSRKVWDQLHAAADCDGDEVYQALLLAQKIHLQEITHLHAHFGTSAATVARLASRFTDVPYTFTAHAKDIFHEYVDHAALADKVADAAAVVTVSDFNVNYLTRKYPAHADKFHRIYNGINLAKFSFRPPVDRPPLILAVGRLVEKKGFPDLIEACARLNDRQVEFKCQIIGSGELEGTLQNHINDRGLQKRVTMLGALPSSQVRRAMHNAAALVAPCVTASTNDQDGLPTVILEAMALGTPVVATDVTGIPEAVLHEQTGLVVPQHAPEQIVDAVGQLLINSQQRVAFAKAARHRAEQLFDVHANTTALRRLFADRVSPYATQPLQEAY